MSQNNKFDFVRALMERSAIVVAEDEMAGWNDLDPDVIEAIDTLLFEDFMLGRLNDTPDDVVSGTVH
jgi:hypothetical protein